MSGNIVFVRIASIMRPPAQMNSVAGLPRIESARSIAAWFPQTAPVGSFAANRFVADVQALRQALFKAVPHLMRIDQIEPGKASDVNALAGKGGKLDKTPFKSSVEDFYLTNPIARASATMAELSRMAAARQMKIAAE